MSTSHAVQIARDRCEARVCAHCAAVGGPRLPLRRSTACGHGACCDNSPDRHAAAHRAATAHWLRFYEDEVAFLLDGDEGMARRRGAFTIVTATLTLFLFGASAPSPLYVAVASLITRKWDGGRAVLAGTVLLTIGVLITLGGIRAGSSPLLSQEVRSRAWASGSHSPAASARSRRSPRPTLAPPDARAGLLATIYVVSYLAFSIPAIIAGLAVTPWGLRDSASGYAVAVSALALAAAAMTAREQAPPSASR